MKDRIIQTLSVIYFVSIIFAFVMAFGVSCTNKCLSASTLGFLAYGLFPFMVNLVTWIVKGKGFL